MKLSIIIPVFNEEKTVHELLKRVERLKIDGVDKEVIVVDDGSTDATASEIKNLILRRGSGQEFKIKNCKIFFHKKNMGKGAAVKTGIENATGEYIIIQDADLEYNPNDIERLLQPIRNGEAKVVYGTRLNRLTNLKRDEKYNCSNRTIWYPSDV